MTAKPIRRLAALGATVATGALIAAAPASSAPVNCSTVHYEAASDGASRCAFITGIDPGSSLRVRSAPSLSAHVVGRLHQNNIIEVDCWTTGPRVSGDRYWVGIYGGGGPTYVPDYYVTTGNPTVWTRSFTHC